MVLQPETSWRHRTPPSQRPVSHTSVHDLFEYILTASTGKKSKRDVSTQELPTEANEEESMKPAMEQPSTSAITGHPGFLEDAPEDAPSIITTKSPTIVKVVIPRTRKPTVPSEHESLQATTPEIIQNAPEDIPTKEADLLLTQSEEQPVTTSQVSKGKKRGRGRPKKETKMIEPIQEEPNEKIQDLKKPPNGGPPEELDNQPEDTSIVVSDLYQSTASKLLEAEKHSGATHITPEPQPPPEKKVKQTIDAPASISKGKTPHRVGLSKRARIAPLLRIVKK